MGPGLTEPPVLLTLQALERYNGERGLGEGRSLERSLGEGRSRRRGGVGGAWAGGALMGVGREVGWGHAGGIQELMD